MGGRLSSLVSTDPDINQDRENALILIRECNRAPYVAKKEDLRWFWQDQDMSAEGLKEMADEYIDSNWDHLNTYYEFMVTEWFMNWYRFMPLVLEEHLSNTGPVDWNLWFTLAKPIPGNLSIPFYLLIRRLNIKQNQILREMIYEEITLDPILSKKILNWEVIPALYTQYTPYTKIRREVVKRLRQNDDYLAEVRSKGIPREQKQMFKQVYKLIKDEGITQDEAFRRVRSQ